MKKYEIQFILEGMSYYLTKTQDIELAKNFIENTPELEDFKNKFMEYYNKLKESK